MYVQAIHVERNLSCGLNCVGVKQNAVQLGEVGEFLDRRQRSHHVVCRHDGNQGYVRLESTEQAVGMGEALGVNRKMSDLGRGFGESTTGFENRGMLNRSRDDVSRATTSAHRANEGKVVGLGAAGGEDDFVGLGADQGGYLRPRGFDGFTSDATFVIQARRIAKRSAEKRSHRREHSRIERRGGGMIEINSRIHGASPAWLRWALRALKNKCLIRDIGTSQLLTEISCPPQTGRELTP